MEQPRQAKLANPKVQQLHGAQLNCKLNCLPPLYLFVKLNKKVKRRQFELIN